MIEIACVCVSESKRTRHSWFIVLPLPKVVKTHMSVAVDNFSVFSVLEMDKKISKMFEQKLENNTKFLAVLIVVIIDILLRCIMLSVSRQYVGKWT